MPYLHLPFQAGADRILAAMNRKHTRRRLSPPGRAHPRGPARHRAVDRHHRRLSRRDRCRVRPDARSRARDRLRPGLFVQVQRPPRHAGRHHGRAGAGRDQDRRACCELQDLLENQQTSFNDGFIGQVVPVLFERTGARGPSGRPLALSAAGPRRGRRTGCSATFCLSQSPRPARTACPARCKRPEPPTRRLIVTCRCHRIGARAVLG